MTFLKSIQITLVAASVLTLAACSSMHKKPQDQSAINEANAAYNGDAQSQGLGDESSFGDTADNSSEGGNSLTKRIYYFDFDSNVVHDNDKPAIVANANHIAANNKAKVMLEGHTDPRGSREYNIGLGERRSKAVAEVLTQKGVNPAQVRIVSYGAEKLASLGHSETDYQRDRRVVLVYLQR